VSKCFYSWVWAFYNNIIFKLKIVSKGIFFFTLFFICIDLSLVKREFELSSIILYTQSFSIIHQMKGERKEKRIFIFLSSEPRFLK